jgi:hypothetical protein
MFGFHWLVDGLNIDPSRLADLALPVKRTFPPQRRQCGWNEKVGLHGYVVTGLSYLRYPRLRGWCFQKATRAFFGQQFAGDVLSK